MRINRVYGAVLAFGLGCTLASAQSDFSGYRAPAKWNRFNVPEQSDFFVATRNAMGQQSVQGSFTVDDLPAPRPEPIPAPRAESLPQPTPEPIPAPLPTDQPMVAHEGEVYSSEYLSAAGSPWTTSARPALARYFGGASLLFLTLENDGYQTLLVDDATGSTQLTTGFVDPGTTTGFEIYAGKYLDCGRYGLSVGYFLWNPSPANVLSVPAAAGNYQPVISNWNNISIDPGTGVATVYAHFDGAAAYRLSRDMFFQGIEVNLSCFGIMGAQRAADCCNDLWLHRCLSRFHSRDCCDPGVACGPSRGYGRAGGPIIRSCNARVQIVNSHGFRWFQVEDAFQFAANINGSAGYQADDLYYDIDTENNLFGYQFGSRLVYCLNRCWNVSIGGKFGLYGNHAEYRQRLGTATTLAYRNGSPTELINTRDSDTVLSTLGELDLGLGYRFNCAWTIRGGYRLLGVTGVATSTGHFATDYSSLASSAHVDADDSLLLHGGYLGAEYNW